MANTKVILKDWSFHARYTRQKRILGIDNMRNMYKFIFRKLHNTSEEHRRMTQK